MGLSGLELVKTSVYLNVSLFGSIHLIHRLDEFGSRVNKPTLALNIFLMLFIILYFTLLFT